MMPSARMVTLLSCAEYAEAPIPPESVIMDGRLTIRTEVSSLLTVDFKDGAPRFRPKGVVGVLPLTDGLSLQVLPRFPVANLNHMLAVCGESPRVLPFLAEFDARAGLESWVRDALTDGLLRQFTEIQHDGLLRTYRRRRDSGSRPHGRIVASTTMAKFAARGIAHRAEYEWFERTVDNGPNALLARCFRVLRRQYESEESTADNMRRRKAIASALNQLRDVPTWSIPDIRRDRFVRDPKRLPATRRVYGPAIDMGKLLLDERTVRLGSMPSRGSTVTFPTVLVDTETLFENFVRTSLRARLTDSVHVRDGNKEGKRPLYRDAGELPGGFPSHHSVSRGQVPDMTPDIVIEAVGDGACPLIAEVKYTPVKDVPKRSEAEQAIVYSNGYSSPVTMTVHPCSRGQRSGLHVSGRVGQTLMTYYLVDLDAKDLNIEMEKMAAAVQGLIELSPELAEA